MVTETKPLTLLRREEVKRRTGLSTSGLYKLMSEGRIPRPVRLSGCVAWPEHEIEGFIQARIAERDAATLKNLKDEPKTDDERGAVARELIAKVAREKANW
jgi:prophage regulatory protein